MPRVEVEKIATLTGHKDCIYTLEGAGKEQSQFYSSGGDGMTVVWDLKNPDIGHLIAKVANSVYALHYLPSQNQLLIGENFQGVHLIDLSTKAELASSAITESSIFDIKSCRDKVLVGTGDGNLVILNLKDLSTITKVKLGDKSVRAISVNIIENHMAAGLSDNTIRVLDLENFKTIATIPAHQNSIFTAVYSPDGRYLLTGSRDAHLKIWDVERNYKLYDSVVAHMYAINHIVFSPDGKYFASCSMDKSIKIWDAEKFSLLKVIDKARHAGHGTSVNKLYWAGYENLLVSCSDDRSISLWKLKFYE